MEGTILRQIVDESPALLVVVNDRGRIAYANPPVSDALGRPADALRGEAAEALFAGWPEPARLRDTATQGKPLGLTARHADGGEVVLDGSLHSIGKDEGDGPTFAAYLRERDPLAVESVVDALPDVFYAFDADGTFIEWNDRLSALTGYENDEIAAMSPLDFVPEDDRDGIAAAIESALSGDHVETRRSSLVTKEGERLPYEFNASRFTDAAGNVAGLVGTGRDISVRKEAEDVLRREKERFRLLVHEVEDYAIFMLNRDGHVESWNQGAEHIKGYAREEIVGQHFSAFYTDEDVADGIPERNLTDAVDRGRVEDEGWRVRKDGSRFWANVVIAPLREDDGTLKGYAKVTRDMTERRERERDVLRQRDELETLNRINVIIRDLVRSLVSAASREEVEETVCTQLTESDLYRSAWIGENDLRDGISKRTQAEDEGFHGRIASAVAEEDWERPAAVALRTGEPQVIRNVPEEPSFPDAVRSAAREHGFHSGIGVPLIHDERAYGVLVVYAARPNAFSEREAAGFEVLGEAVAFAINAIEQERLLASDSVVELELRLTGSNVLLADLSRRTDSALVLEGTVPASDGEFVYYVRAVDAAPERVTAVVTDAPAVSDCRVVSERSDEALVALTVTSSVVEVLVGAGANVRTVRAESGEQRMVAEVARDANVRALVEALRTVASDVELVSKREVKRSTRTESEFRRRFAEGLTDRQYATFRAAHLAGYFDWPRASTAEEIADSMSVSSATFHQHLRTAQRKLADAFFDESNG